jgi:hypothetical protein
LLIRKEARRPQSCPKSGNELQTLGQRYQSKSYNRKEPASHEVFQVRLLPSVFAGDE